MADVQIEQLWKVSSVIRADVSALRQDVAGLQERSALRGAQLDQQASEIRALSHRISWLIGGLAALVVIAQLIVPGA